MLEPLKVKQSKKKSSSNS